jgi:hypothetical protein
LQEYNNPATLADFLRETGQENDPDKLVLAREMALDTGIYAECTPRMAWNFCFGDKKDFFAEKAAQNRARDVFSQAPLVSSRPPKRTAPEEAQDAPVPRSKNKRRCLTCQQEGHNSRTCKRGDQRSLAQDAAIPVRASRRKRRCGICSSGDHDFRNYTVSW